MCVKILARWHFEYSPHILIRISGFRIFIRIFLHTAWSSSSRSSSDLNCFATRGRETKIVEISVMRKNFLRGWIFQQKLWNFFFFFLCEIDMLMYGIEVRRGVWCLSYNKAEEKKRSDLLFSWNHFHEKIRSTFFAKSFSRKFSWNW